MPWFLQERQLGSDLWIWTFDPVTLIPLLVLAVSYERRRASLARRGRPVPGRYRLAFHAGIAALIVAFASPLDWLGEERLFVAHMAQHLLLGDVAPLLLVLGLTGPVLRPVLALRIARPLMRLTNPLVALPVWAFNLYVWHAPVAYDLALGNDAVHAVQHLCFLAGGVVLWWPVVGPVPGPRWFGWGGRLLYVLTARGIEWALATILFWSQTPFYPTYSAFPRVTASLTPIVDQNYGGALMLLEGSIVTLAMLAWIFNAWASDSEARQQLEERGLPARSPGARRPVTGPPPDPRRGS